MYAIIETGGKQFKVKEGDIIKVEKLGVDTNSSFTFENILLVNKGTDTILGMPYVNGATVNATVISNGKNKKLIVYKYKPKKGYHKKKGHRQPFTELKIDKINA